MKIEGIPHYRALDESGEADAAADRMEARAREPASGELFEALVAPLLDPAPGRVLELGCGTAALARRIAGRLPGARVHGIDKSERMIARARALVSAEGLENLELAAWDVAAEGEGPFGDSRYGLIVSSVLVPYLDDAEIGGLVVRCAGRLAPGGLLAFLEQDLLTDSVAFRDHALQTRIYDKDGRTLRRTLGLGLRPLLADAGLEPLPRRSFLWTDEAYGAYCRDLLRRIAADAGRAGRVSADEQNAWLEGLEEMARDGEFYYGLVYHRIAGRKPGAPGSARSSARGER